MATVIIDDTSKDGQEMLKRLRGKDYATILSDEEAEDWWQTISEAERQSIERGLQDLANGKTVDHEQVRELYAKWL